MNTLLIAVIDTAEKSAELLCIGDGLICIDGRLFEFEQDNKPDYLGYHLHEDFESWFGKQQQRISQSGIDDLSLATDGIFTFKKFDSGSYKEPEDVIHFLLQDKAASGNSNMLDRKMTEIERDWGLKPTDDLAVTRVIFGQ